MSSVGVIHVNFVERSYKGYHNPKLAEAGHTETENSRAIRDLKGMMRGLSNLMYRTTCEIELANLQRQKDQLSAQVSALKLRGRDLIKQFEEEQQKVIQRWNARMAQ